MRPLPRSRYFFPSACRRGTLPSATHHDGRNEAALRGIHGVRMYFACFAWISAVELILGSVR